MPELTSSYPETQGIFKTSPLPLSSIVRALCQAANAGPDLLYEVMLKLSLLIEAAAPMYGLSMWKVDEGQKPRLNWAEGLDEAELATGQKIVGDALAPTASWPEIKEGDSSVCFVLTSLSQGRAGAALYGLCVRSLSAHQARELGAIVDITR
jgi:hypothetical protein